MLHLQLRKTLIYIHFKVMFLIRAEPKCHQQSFIKFSMNLPFAFFSKELKKQLHCKKYFIAIFVHYSLEKNGIFDGVNEALKSSKNSPIYREVPSLWLVFIERPGGFLVKDLRMTFDFLRGAAFEKNHKKIIICTNIKD